MVLLSLREHKLCKLSSDKHDSLAYGFRIVRFLTWSLTKAEKDNSKVRIAIFNAKNLTNQPTEPLQSNTFFYFE